MPKTPTGTSSARALVVLAVLAGTALALDQFTKHLVVTNLPLGEQVPVLGELLILQFVKNPGAAFSLAAGSTWIFSILATGVTVAIIIFARKIRSIGWAVVFGLLLGGVLGNLTDRLLREPSFGLGHVIDFISTPWMMPAIYNVADVCIVSSMGLFIILTLRGINLDGTRTVSSKKPEADATALPGSDAVSSERGDLKTDSASTTSAPESPAQPDSSPDAKHLPA
ncbi:signal peptidase II [Okibacterium sp. HSC-33S16]|uniref:signal peptidase II n=1 Tax=Okibacterium sp. HSC-33S16 TaxID=2910965 RepID=UPI002112476D|nr:signal peptidase II [Okibacterium sp. HSC-33S16]MCP2032762.1 signal peptidase II [Okibacterium sp. HSC-33S16]